MITTTASHRFPSCIRSGALMFSCLAVALLSSCTIYWDQIEVPGTDQRLIVGGQVVFLGPLPQIWVMEGDVVERVHVEHAK